MVSSRTVGCYIATTMLLERSRFMTSNMTFLSSCTSNLNCLSGNCFYKISQQGRNHLREVSKRCYTNIPKDIHTRSREKTDLEFWKLVEIQRLDWNSAEDTRLFVGNPRRVHVLRVTWCKQNPSLPVTIELLNPSPLKLILICPSANLSRTTLVPL